MRKSTSTPGLYLRKREGAMRKSITVAGLGVLAVLLMAGCSDSSSTPVAKNAPEPSTVSAATPETITGKSAFWPMYKAAHNWAPDIVLIRLTAKPLSGFKNEAGKAPLWEAAFGSPSLHQYRIFTNSIATVPPAVFKGVTGGLAMPWGGETRDAMAIDLTQFNVDSDAAYQTGSGLAGDWLKKNPGKELASLEVGETYRFQGPVWYLQWGDKKAGYSALIDANSGKNLNRK